MHSSLNLPRNPDLGASLSWIDTLHNNNGSVVGQVPSNTGLSVRLGWHYTKQLEFSLAGHDQHLKHDLPSAMWVEIERSVFGKVQWRF